MSLCLIGTRLPVTARAEDSSPDKVLCEHHTEHTTECGYVAPAEEHECGHVHDESCGYQEASEGSSCTYICKICEVQELIDALPDAEDITEDNFDDVSDMLDEIDTAKEATNTSYGYSNTDSSAANRKKTGGNAYWWLWSAYSDFDSLAGVVYSDGYIDDGRVGDGSVGVSPALNVSLSSVIFSSVLSGTSGQPGAEYEITLYALFSCKRD